MEEILTFLVMLGWVCMMAFTIVVMTRDPFNWIEPMTKFLLGKKS